MWGDKVWCVEKEIEEEGVEDCGGIEVIGGGSVRCIGGIGEGEL